MNAFFKTPSITRAQDVIICDFCENPAKQFCSSCQVGLCENCITSHKDEFKSLSHDINNYSNCHVKLAFPACSEHPDKRCEAHCQQCHMPVCIKCFMGIHQGHKAEELTRETRIEEINYETQEIQRKIIPNLEKENSEIGIRISIDESKFDKDGEDTENKRKLWHKEVDTIFDKIGSLRQLQLEKNFDARREYQKKIQGLISEMKKTVEQNKKILDSKKLSQVNAYRSKRKEYIKSPEKVGSQMPVVNAKIQENELNIGIGDFKATLTQGMQSTSTTKDTKLTANYAYPANPDDILTQVGPFPIPLRYGVRVSTDKPTHTHRSGPRLSTIPTQRVYTDPSGYKHYTGCRYNIGSISNDSDSSN